MWKCVLAVFVSQLAILVAQYTPIDYHHYYYPPSADLPSTHDSRCSLGIRRFETVDLQGAVICGQTQVNAEVWKGICLNRRSNCMTHHYAFACFKTESYCLPGATETVTQTVTVTGSNCQQDIQIRFENITECKCTMRTSTSSC